MRTKSLLFAVVLMGVVTGPVMPAYALAGGLATTNITGANDQARALALQPDGKIVAAGGNGTVFALARYNPNGTLDAGFGTGGTVTTRVPGPPLPRSLSHAIAVQPDGKIVAAGQLSSSVELGLVALVRYNQDGSLDPTFSGDGIVTTTIRGLPGTAANALAIGPDGRITVVGATGDFFAARYNPDGSLDPGFGNGGIVVAPAGGWAQAMFLRADGRIVAAGTASADFRVVRYNPNGSLDPTFGQGGTATTDFAGGADEGRAVVNRPDNRIVVAGFGPADIELAAYNQDGSLDTTFGQGGKVTTDIANTQDEANGAALQADGKLVVAGRAGNDFALVRYNANGTLDTTFGRGGKVTTDFAGGADSAAAVTIQPDGRIIVAGRAANAGTGNDFALARYNPNGTLDPSFGA
jgi:uncharacterized delta-60 repeat protein